MKNRELTAQRTALGLLLKSIREEKGLLQREVAQRLGAPQSFVSKYESGERRIDLPELRCIAGVLEAPIDWLLTRYETAIARTALAMIQPDELSQLRKKSGYATRRRKRRKTKT